jgi:hypothetical protein
MAIYMYRINRPNNDAVGLTMIMAIAVTMALCVGAPAQKTPAGSALPRLVRFSGTAKDAGGNPVTGVTGITFALYAEQTGGAPLWSETQSVQAGADGHYTVLLGAAKSEGLPADLFTAEQAHWVGVSVEGQAEQPRILLVSAPYALKAGDAETLGGLPPSAFLLAAAPSPSGRAPESPNASPAAASAIAPAVSGTGTADYIPIWTDSSGNLSNSAMFQAGAGGTAKIGINTTTPATTLDVEGGGTIRGPLSLPAIGPATATAGQNSQPLTFATSVFDSGTSAAINENFQWQAEPVGNDTSRDSGTLNLLFGSRKSTPAETGLSIASNGRIAFAAGQTFPGTGTITGVTAGTDLTGGGATGNITLNLDTTKVPQLAANNTFIANQTVDGSVTAASFSGSGAGLTNVNASLLGGLGTSAYAQLAANNFFSGQQVITGTNTSGVLQVTNTVTSGQGPAIVGTTDSSAAAGIKGIVAATSGTEAGVVGSTSSPNGYGLYGLSPNVGVYGSAGGSSILGTQGYGVFAGAWGDTGTDGFEGVLGTADDGFGGFFVNNSDGDPTLLAVNNYVASNATVFAAYGSGLAGCYIDGGGDLVCSGTVSGAVPAGAQQVSVYATQSTENWFEDAGAGQLLNGSTRIDLDATFAQTVNTGVAYHVFLTPKGDCKGLYVSGETAQGFEVHEMGGGRSNIAFDYRIMAKRSGFENVRLADVTKKSQDMEQRRKALHERTAPRRAQQAETNR